MTKSIVGSCHDSTCDDDMHSCLLVVYRSSFSFYRQKVGSYMDVGVYILVNNDFTGNVGDSEMTFKDLFRRLIAKRIIATSEDKTKGLIEYRVTLTPAEYEELEKLLEEK